MSERMYSAHIDLEQEGKDIRLYFSRLTLKQAQTLNLLMHNNYSHVHSSAEVQSYGWEITQ